ncbi:hypothetical protein SNE40_021165 [Patella caerulea]|uniref:Dolichyl-phosphate beta-glucosyltransferase n=1 Tax=Patella caerulea TaxID=87958 RepID=A0AAN8IX83_PATCE
MALFCLCELMLYLVVLALTVVVSAIVFIYLNSERYPSLSFHSTETTFYHSPDQEASTKFPSLKDESSLDLTIVVPAYNEEKRLPVMLDEALEYLENRNKISNFTYEIVIVDDGSKDATSKVGLKYSQKYGTDKVRVMTLYKNRGKGGAVRQGMLVGRGTILLFADADGASKFSDVEKLEEELEKICENGLAVVCGSRAHLEEESIAHRSIFRTFLMHGFHFLVSFLCVRGVRDTQCGFKLLSRHAADVLFSNLHVNRWAFDVDLLYLAQFLKVPISEVAVKWEEIEGSKMVPVLSWIEMGLDILLIRLRYLIGAWKIRDLKSME